MFWPPRCIFFARPIPQSCISNAISPVKDAHLADPRRSSPSGSPKPTCGDEAPAGQNAELTDEELIRLLSCARPLQNPADASDASHDTPRDPQNDSTLASLRGQASPGRTAKLPSRTVSNGINKGLRKSFSAPKMAQPAVSRRSTQDVCRKFEETADQFSAQYPNHSLQHSISLDFGGDSTSRSVPNFSRPMSFQTVSSGSNGSFGHQSNYGPAPSHRGQFTLQYGSYSQSAAQTPPTPQFSGEFSPASYSNATSPQAEQTSMWDQDSMNRLDFSLDATMASSLDDSRMQPWWPPQSGPSDSAFLLPQQQQQQRQVPSSQQRRQSQSQSQIPHQYTHGYMPSIPDTESGSFGVGGLMINTNKDNQVSSYHHHSPYSHESFVSTSPKSPSPGRKQRMNSLGRTPSPGPSTRATSTTRLGRRSSRGSLPLRSQSQHRRSKSGTTMSPRIPMGHPHQASFSGAGNSYGGNATGVIGAQQQALPASQQPNGNPANHYRHQSAAATNGKVSLQQSQPGQRLRHPSTPSVNLSRPAAGSQASPAEVGFVNYTPDDRHKILTGVAKSGSSKTKERREKQAAESRRRLLEGARRAVLNGDVKALDAEGFAME